MIESILIAGLTLKEVPIGLCSGSIGNLFLSQGIDIIDLPRQTVKEPPPFDYRRVVLSKAANCWNKNGRIDGDMMLLITLHRDGSLKEVNVVSDGAGTESQQSKVQVLKQSLRNEDFPFIPKYYSPTNADVMFKFEFAELRSAVGRPVNTPSNNSPQRRVAKIGGAGHLKQQSNRETVFLFDDCIRNDLFAK